MLNQYPNLIIFLLEIPIRSSNVAIEEIKHCKQLSTCTIFTMFCIVFNCRNENCVSLSPLHKCHAISQKSACIILLVQMKYHIWVFILANFIKITKIISFEVSVAFYKLKSAKTYLLWEDIICELGYKTKVIFPCC